MSLGFKHGDYMRRDTGHVTLTLHCIEILYEKVWIFGLCICVFTRFSSVFVKLLWKSICSLQISMYMKSISEKNSFHRFVLFIKSYIIQFFVSTKVRGLTKHVNLNTTLFPPFTKFLFLRNIWFWFHSSVCMSIVLYLRYFGWKFIHLPFG